MLSSDAALIPSLDTPRSDSKVTFGVISDDKNISEEYIVEIYSVIERADRNWARVVQEIISAPTSFDIDSSYVRLARFYVKTGEYYAIIYISSKQKSNKYVARMAGLEYSHDK